MTRRLPRLTRVAAPAVLAAAALLAVSACGDATPEQSKEHSVIAGVDTQIGDVLIRNATITVDPGGTTGTLDVALFNKGTAGDALTSVTSDHASFDLPDTAALASSPAPATGTPNAARSGARSLVTASPPTSPGVELAAQTGVFLNTDPRTIRISELSPSLVLGQTLPLTMSFATAGSITLRVPVTATTGVHFGGLETASPAVSGAGAENGDSQPDVQTGSPTPFAGSTSIQPTPTTDAGSSAP